MNCDLLFNSRKRQQVRFPDDNTGDGMVLGTQNTSHGHSQQSFKYKDSHIMDWDYLCFNIATLNSTNVIHHRVGHTAEPYR